MSTSTTTMMMMLMTARQKQQHGRLILSSMLQLSWSREQSTLRLKQASDSFSRWRCRHCLRGHHDDAERRHHTLVLQKAQPAASQPYPTTKFSYSSLSSPSLLSLKFYPQQQRMHILQVSRRKFSSEASESEKNDGGCKGEAETRPDSSLTPSRQHRAVRQPTTIFRPLYFEHFEVDHELENDDDEEGDERNGGANIPPPSSSSLPASSFSPIFVPRDDPILRQAVRSCFKEYGDGAADDDKSSSSSQSLQTDMSLCFFGTSSGSPMKARNTTSTMLRMDGALYIFDVGEGTQRQLQFSPSIVLSRITKIFITHLHGDHIFGLPGLILGLQNTSMTIATSANDPTKKNKTKKMKGLNQHVAVDEYGHLVVQVYGPPGLFNFLASSIVLSCTVLHSIKVEVYELVGGKVKRVHGTVNTNNKRQRNFFRDPFHDRYPELEDFGGKLYHSKIHAKDGVWTISDFYTPDEKKAKILENSRSSPRRVRIRAAEVDHLSGVSTFGFVVEEDDHPRNIDPSKAMSLNVSPSNKKYELLKYGFPVLADDGTTEVQPSEVLVDSVTKCPRKVAVVGDNRGWTTEMFDIAQNADVLVHEATLVDDDYIRGHSTPTMAGRRGADCDAGVLVLNHLSPRIESDLPMKVEEAYDATGRRIPVVPAYDFMELKIPTIGFRRSTTPTSPTTTNLNDEGK